MSTILDYYIALGIHKAQTQKLKKILVSFSLLGNLGMLFAFKYFGFFTEIINLFIADDFSVVKVLIPVGISFYTFQTLSYTIDVYRGIIEPESNFIRFSLYVSFFPQLVAGPIVKAKEFFPQLKERYQELGYLYSQFSGAILLIIFGLTKKFLGDFMGENIVDRYYDNPTMYTTAEGVFTFYAYSMQIYCDFSGYTDIAIGSAQLLGFTLPINFNRPYLAVTLSDFWRRWHISLSTWLRDYLYISLGGNQQRVYLNLFITMFLAGLWHGPKFNYVIWGLLHAVVLISERLLGLAKLKREDLSFGKRVLATIFTFHIVTITWIAFRLQNLTQFDQLFQSLSELTFSLPNVSFTLAALLIAFFLIHITPTKLKDTLVGFYIRFPAPLHSALILIACMALYQIYIADANPFIYFQF